MGFYLMFVGGSVICVAYFLHAHFWFLDIDLDGMHVHTLCKLIVAAAVPSLLIPGFVRLQIRPALCAAALLLQATLVAVMEESMYAGCASRFVPAVFCVCVFFLFLRRQSLAGCGLLMTWRRACMLGVRPTRFPLGVFSIVRHGSKLWLKFDKVWVTSRSHRSKILTHHHWPLVSRSHLHRAFAATMRRTCTLRTWWWRPQAWAWPW